MAWTTWADVPVGEQNAIKDLADRWMQLSGFKYIVDQNVALINMANQGVTTLGDMGKYMNTHTDGTLNTTMPWAMYGLSRDAYSGLSTSYGTEYQKLTGQTIDPATLTGAFTNVKDPTGNNFLSASQYAQQLQQDKSIQDTYGWVKYGLDYNQFQQHKASMAQAFGGTPTDSQGVQALQYWHQNQQATQQVQAQPASQAKNAPVTPGAAQSVIR